MEAIAVSSNTIVPRALDGSNYEIWSSCMEDYLSGQGLWKVIIEAEPQVEAGDLETWREKNSMALHAIKVSCGPNVISKVVKLKSAKEAWDLLAAAAAADVAFAAAAATDAAAADAAAADAAFAAAAAVTAAEEVIDYGPFTKAVMDENWESMEKFIDRHPHAVAAKVFGSDDAVLHSLLHVGHDKPAALLLDRMTLDDMETQDIFGNTALGVGAQKMYPGRLQTLELMVSKHPNLPNIGAPLRLPVTVAAWNGFEETTRYFYSVTDKNIFNPEYGTHGVELLINCIESKIFDVASKLVEEFPDNLWKLNYKGNYPTRALATTFSGLFSDENLQKKSGRLNFGEYMLNCVHHLLGRDNKISNDDELIRDQARAFLHLVCAHVSTVNTDLLYKTVSSAMIEATKHGNFEFINEMLSARPNLITAYVGDDGIFVYAIKNRRHKIFSLIYPAMEQRDALLANPKEGDDTPLHFAAMLAPPHILDRTSGPALQVQTELQWFKEVWNVVGPRDRERLNNDNLTPRQLFTISHEKLIEAGEKSLKDTAASSTVVGALIVTMMFAAAFTVPGGNNEDGYPLFVNERLFKTFIVCDALSLYSSATSVLIFLGILTSRYAENDFLLFLPRKLMLGISTLFFSITTMMVTFCAALAIMLHGRLQFIFPIVLLAFVPIILFLTGPTLPEKPATQLDENWVQWLSKFEPRSVVYCAFGSQIELQKDQFQELLLGFELCELPFLVALPPPQGYLTVEEAFPEGFEDRIRGKGWVYGGWVPQTSLLDHPSVGCFVSHGGSASMWESLLCDSQIVLVPNMAEQIIQTRLMVEELKVAVEVERTGERRWVSKESLSKAIELVMDKTSEVACRLRINHANLKDLLSRKGLQEEYMDAFVQNLQDMKV